MNNLFQKIISRSEGFAAVSKRSVPHILPDKPLFFNDKQSSFIKKEVPKTEFINDPYENTSGKPAFLNNRQSESVNINNSVQSNEEVSSNSAQDNDQENNKPLPFTETPFNSKKDELTHSNPLDHSGDEKKILPPSATILEKINQRNFQKILIGKKAEAIKLMPETHSDSSFANLNASNWGKVHKEKEEKTEKHFSPAKKQLQPEQSGQKVKEQLLPAQKDNLFINTGKKTGQSNRLVIGRITVEIINPTPEPVKTKEPPLRQNNSNKASNTEFTSINKLSFGLGQL